MNSKDIFEKALGGVLGMLLVFGPLVAMISVFLLWPIHKIVTWLNPDCEFFPSITRCIGGDPNFNADWMTLTTVILAIVTGIMWG